MSDSTGPGEPSTTPPPDQPPTGQPRAEKPAGQDSAEKPPAEKPSAGKTSAGKTRVAKPAKKPPTPEQLERRKTILRWVVFVGGGAVLTVLLYFVLSAFIPRWWAQTIGRQAGGRISGGILIGLMYGFIFTFLPLIVLAQARHRAFDWKAKAIIVLVAAALTAPNLMTLGISIGNSAAAHAGERTLDVTAPGFRQATLWGVILGALTAAVVITFWVLWERRGSELKLLRARVDQLEKELPPALPAPTSPPKPPKP